MVARYKQALYFKAKNFGDSIILTASIAALPKDYRYVDVICFPESKPIFQMNKRVRHIFLIPRDKKGIKKIAAYIDLFMQLFKEHYDLLAQFSNDWRGAILARLLFADIKVSRQTPRRGYFWHHSFHFLAPALDYERPMAEQDVDLLRACDLYKKKEAPPYQLEAPKKNQLKIKKWLKAQNILKSKLIVIHTSSRWGFKEIPIGTWVTIIDTLKSKNMHVVLSGSKDDLKTNEAIRDLCQSEPILTYNFSLEDTAALYKIADLVVTIDSMSTHLASAMKTPVVSIFGPTNDLNWRPWKVKYEVVALSVADDPIFSCRPCGMDGCEGMKISQCLVQMKPQMILKSIESTLKN